MYTKQFNSNGSLWTDRAAILYALVILRCSQTLQFQSHFFRTCRGKAIISPDKKLDRRQNQRWDDKQVKEHLAYFNFVRRVFVNLEESRMRPSIESHPRKAPSRNNRKECNDWFAKDSVDAKYEPRKGIIHVPLLCLLVFQKHCQVRHAEIKT